MRIINQSRELTKVEKYQLTQSPDMLSMKDIDDEAKITVNAWCVYEDINSKDDEVEILTILTPDNQIYCTQSATFKEDFMNIVDIMEENEVFTIIKRSGTTKAGRPYVYCLLDVGSVQ